MYNADRPITLLLAIVPMDWWWSEYGGRRIVIQSSGSMVRAVVDGVLLISEQTSTAMFFVSLDLGHTRGITCRSWSITGIASEEQLFGL